MKLEFFGGPGARAVKGREARKAKKTEACN